MRLNIVDFPTLGLPTIATIGAAIMAPLSFLTVGFH